MLTKEQMSHSLRMAGDIKRYHTWPVLNEQTNAHHTWNVLRIWIELFGAPTGSVTVAIMTHDCGELKTGDLPFDGKRASPDFARSAKAVEEEHLNAMLDRHQSLKYRNLSLSLWDKVRIKCCDLLEMGEFALKERAMGNLYGELIFSNVEAALCDIINDPDMRGHKDLDVVVERMQKMHYTREKLFTNLFKGEEG